MAIQGQAWKVTQEKNSPECIYRMQVNGIKGVREENRVEKAMAGWELAGDGYNGKTGETTLFFRRDFGSVDKFIAWGKSFQEFPLEELDKHGDVKKYVRIGPRGGSGGSQRVCGKCGKPGHNARTCGTERAVKPAKGTRKCSKCGEVGHNARTCKNGWSPAKIKEAVQKVALSPKGKRKCGKCGGVGHNARTCKATDEVSHNAHLALEAVKKLTEKGKYKCGGCGEYGHNKRTCPNK